MAEYTIDDIARDLGVSKTTVSRALSGKGRISRETRDRILDYTEACGFRPNAVAKGLAQNKTYNICMVMPEEDMSRGFQFFREFLQGVCTEASARDYDVMVTVGGDGAQLRRILENGKVDGVISARGEVGSAAERIIREHGTPFVLVGPGRDEGAVYVDNANVLAASELTRLLFDRGVAKPALLGGSGKHLVTHSRAEGFRGACESRGIADAMVFLDIESESDAHSALDAALSRGAGAILCMDDAICQMVMRGLARRGVPVPGGVKVACLYDSFLLESISPSVTAARFDGVRLGQTACDRLITLIETGESESVTLPEFEIIMRESL